MKKKFLSAFFIVMTIFATGVFTSCSSSDDDSSDSGSSETVKSGVSTITYTFYLSQFIKTFYDVDITYTKNGTEVKATLADASVENLKTTNNSYPYQKYTITTNDTLYSNKTSTYKCYLTLTRNSNALNEENIGSNYLVLCTTPYINATNAKRVKDDVVDSYTWDVLATPIANSEDLESFAYDRISSKKFSTSISVKYKDGESADLEDVKKTSEGLIASL